MRGSDLTRKPLESLGLWDFDLSMEKGNYPGLFSWTLAGNLVFLVAKATCQTNKDANFLWIFIIKKINKISSVLAINLSRSRKIFRLTQIGF